MQDTGPGIAPEEIGQIFEAFTQTASGQEMLEGTGLGLPLSRHFVQLIGGDITVESPPSIPPAHGGEEKGGLGSLFRFDIQVALPADVSEIENLKSKIQNRVLGLAPQQQAADGTPYRILVAEDREANRVLLVQLLMAVGFEVREAVNGQEALAVWAAWQPHLIWMDMRMPVMDGYETTKQIKSKINNLSLNEVKGPKSKIIALTAHAFEEERTAILAAGCDDFVRKPFKEAEIFDKMAQHLGVRYIYEDLVQLTEQNDDTQTQVTLRPDALVDLPADWMIELKQAVSRGRAERILKLLEQIEAEHPALARAMTKLVKEYRFEELMALTAQTSPKEE